MKVPTSGEMGTKIRVVSLHRFYKISETLVRSLAEDILRIIGKKNKAEIEIIFLDDKSMREYNRKYASKDRATDVLSFGIDRRDFGQKVFLGEILISLDTALNNSRLYGTDFANEIVLYITHGILHLFGYDDGTAADSRKMVKKQDQIMGRLCCCRNLSEVLMPR